ncbi:MAG: lysine--tRNA ligase [Candidatus Sungbacteria bacterium]|uniref:Lysine--tRNA ligase n=1 Tax=Candidatus Sungiibacteriota bacterium TaxID=2750080 RepID=A0A9D6LTL8_9BACT|nr:lysine--tRNA ligase [Candidatus Sungbacteria bacterium]
MPLEDIRAERLKKLEALKSHGLLPYPPSSSRSFRIGAVVGNFDAYQNSRKEVIIAGRVMARRDQGAISFVDVRDESGKIQVLCKAEKLGELYQNIAGILDVGDIIEVTGTAFTTNRGEKSLEAAMVKVLAKSLLPLPDKWHGLVDIEERLRRRYLDILMDPEERELFYKKSRFWKAIRDFLIREEFLEVETPILEHTPGGADAEPFSTHLNALDIDLYLRISPELHLKRLLVAGFEKVFEIGRVFRNEGIDREHLQDYTQMELYWAYADYEMLMEAIERMVKEIIRATLGTMTTAWENKTIDWSSEWPRIDYYETFAKYTGINLGAASAADLKKYAGDAGIDTTKHLGRGRLIDVIFKKKVRPTLIQPAFLLLPPVEIEPLAKRSEQFPDRVLRFQIVACATELGKGFSELNDPIDQRDRFKEQLKLREAGDTEAQRMDADFVEALEYGMPPSAGFGMSERFFSILVGRPMRETVFEPLMRDRKSDK